MASNIIYPMDKQQATNHILTRLRAGYSPEEIADELSRILKAPAEVTSRFVNQVAASHPEAVPPPPTPQVDAPAYAQEMPEWLEPLPIRMEAEIQPASAAATGSQYANLDLPPGLLALINERGTPREFEEPAPTSGEPLPRQAKFVAPVVKSDDLDDDLSPKIDLDSLSAEVIRQLKSQKRFNDVVEYVCGYTGWHWNKSQRFVARVKTKHHEELISGQNRTTIIIGIGIILVGLVMMLNGASVISDYAKLAVFARTNPEALFSISPQALIFALMATVTGIGMIIGGGYGVGRALTSN